MSIDCFFGQLHELFTKDYFDSVQQFRLAMALTLPFQVVVALVFVECFGFFGNKCLKCLKGCARKEVEEEEESQTLEIVGSLGRLVPYLLTIFFFINPVLIQEYFQGLLCVPLTE